MYIMYLNYDVVQNGKQAYVYDYIVTMHMGLRCPQKLTVWKRTDAV